MHSGESLLIDARSPSEYAHAHIPGAFNIPLLNDEQRKLIGIIYKNEGRQKAVLEGFRVAGPDFHKKAEEALQLLERSGHTRTHIYCWRGGMRSEILQWILRLSGISAEKIASGYKSYRNTVLSHFTRQYDLRVLGGKTGSGKTSFLNHIEEQGHQVIDLEALANHKGSAFGGLGTDGQPSNEMFENLIFEKLRLLDISRPVWVENESRSIGRAMIPQHFYEQMRAAKVIEIDPGYDHRFKRIKKEYGGFSTDLLAESTGRIRKRLGPNNMKTALEFLSDGKFDEWLRIILAYYDKLYEHSSSLRATDSVTKVPIDADDIPGSVKRIINHV